MQMEMERSESAAHVLLLPFPAQGHITPMLSFAQLLCHAGIHVTFLNTEHNHRLLTQRHALSARFPTLHFESLPDGLPPDCPRSIPPLIDMLSSLRSVTKPLLGDLLITLTKKDEESYGSTTTRRPPLSRVIMDEIMCFAIDVAEKVGVPVMAITIISGCGFWSYSCIPNLSQQGHLPFTDKDMDKQSRDIPGMEGLLRRRDLPGFCRFSIDHPVTKILMEETKAITRASVLIINTFDGLEASILSHIATLFPQVYAIGPVHALVKSRVGDGLSSSASLRQEDRRCMAWLDSKQVGSVIYVSFGSLVKLTHDQLFEFWHGLVSCGKQFLWVVRSDMISGKKGEHVIPTELKMGTKERGLIVEWAPQEEVLAHKAVGGFLTQCGWNSILEGIWAGVPMLCWPRLAEQLVTSRWIGEVWRIGIDMKDTCERSMVEKMIRRLMEEGDEREQILRSVERFSKLARGAVTEGGSSYNNLDKLIQDLRNL